MHLRRDLNPLPFRSSRGFHSSQPHPARAKVAPQRACGHLRGARLPATPYPTAASKAPQARLRPSSCSSRFAGQPGTAHCDRAAAFSSGCHRGDGSPRGQPPSGGRGQRMGRALRKARGFANIHPRAGQDGRTRWHQHRRAHRPSHLPVPPWCQPPRGATQRQVQRQEWSQGLAVKGAHHLHGSHAGQRPRDELLAGLLGSPAQRLAGAGGFEGHGSGVRP